MKASFDICGSGSRRGDARPSEMGAGWAARVIEELIGMEADGREDGVEVAPALAIEQEATVLGLGEGEVRA
jgi:hypothetical protein